MKGNYKMKVSIFGGSGFVGEYIINELIELNNKPYALVRYGNSSKILNKEEIETNIKKIRYKYKIEYLNNFEANTIRSFLGHLNKP